MLDKDSVQAYDAEPTKIEICVNVRWGSMAAKGKKKHTSIAARVSPQVQLVILCDAVARDPNSGKATLYGLFDSFVPRRFPATLNFAVYLKLVGGNGTNQIGLDFLDAAGKSVLSGDKPKIAVDCRADRQAVVIVHLAALRIVKAGDFQLIVKCNNRRLGQPIQVIVKKPPRTAKKKTPRRKKST